MRISIVIPVHDNEACLRQCLAALPSPGPDVEIIVVDDASTPPVAARPGIELLRLASNAGPGAARNHGARRATGDVLLFVDSDVVVAPDAVERMRRVLDRRPDVAAAFGSYDASPRAPGVVSQFRNLLLHFVHQHGDPEASTFWAGCGAIRRAVFEAVGGFDEGDYTRSIEDIELGYRVRAAGHRILLDREIVGTHLKRWTLASMLRTDVQYRAIPWARLILQRRRPLDHLNLKAEQRASVALALLGAVALVLAVLVPPMILLAVAAGIGLVAANRALLVFFARARGIGFAAATVPLLFLHYLGSALAYLWVRGGLVLARALRRTAPLRKPRSIGGERH